MAYKEGDMRFLLDLPPEYYAAIGEIATRWTWIEHQLGVIIRLILGIKKPQGRVLTMGMAVKVKAAMLPVLADKMVQNKQLKADLRKLSKSARDLIYTRNDLVHGLYAEETKKPGVVGRFMTKSSHERYQPRFEATPIEELRKAANQMKALQDEAQRITDALKGKAPAN